MKNKKDILISVLYFFAILFLVINMLKLFCRVITSREYEIAVSSKNRQEILKMLENRYEESQVITKIKLRPKLGDGELYIYSNFQLVKKTKVSEGNDIMQYMLENGKNVNINYIRNIVIALFFILLIKSYKEDQNEATTI